MLAILLLWTVCLLAYRWIDPPITPLMLLRLASEPAIQHRSVALGAIAPSLAQAVIASEDNRFCLHHGIDWGAVEDALDDYQQGEKLRGASTITMQVARNLFLWPGGGFARKSIEAILALSLDAAWPKRRIVEVYLNIAEWGHGIYGAEAAAQAHFHKPASRLTRQEAALLASVLPNPRRWNPAQPTGYIERRAAVIALRIDQLGPLLACTH